MNHNSSSQKRNFLFFLIFISFVSFQACQQPVEGCTNPRAVNFNAEADKDLGCSYYQLTLEMQYVDNTGAPFTYATTLTDTDGIPFLINKMPVLTSQYHLKETTSNTIGTAAEKIGIVKSNGTRVQTEDNFAILDPSTTSIQTAGWATLGTFDQLEFLVGIDENIRNGNPSKIEEQSHPLSTTATSYMYDSTSTQYATSLITVSLPNTGQNRTFNLFDTTSINIPYTILVEDGLDVFVRLRMNYEALFNSVSFTNDTDSLIALKIKQNFRTSFSTY